MPVAAVSVSDLRRELDARGRAGEWRQPTPRWAYRRDTRAPLPDWAQRVRYVTSECPDGILVCWAVHRAARADDGGYAQALLAGVCRRVPERAVVVAHSYPRAGVPGGSVQSGRYVGRDSRRAHQALEAWLAEHPGRFPADVVDLAELRRALRAGRAYLRAVR